jgi:VWFA-related protein
MPRTVHLGRTVLCGVLLVALAVTPAGTLGQATPQNPQNPPVFRTGVNVVELEVSVLDPNRKPVTGLTAADFTVLDDGAPRPIVAFSAVDLPDPKPAAAAWITSTGPDVISNQFAERRIVILVFGDMLPSSDEVDLESMRRMGHAIISRLGPADLASVMFLYSTERSEGFTTSRATLDEAVDRLEGMPVPYSAATKPLDRTLDPVSNVLESLQRLQDRRKVVFFVGDDSAVEDRSSRRRLYETAERADVNINCLRPSLRTALPPPNDFCKEVASNTNGTAVTDRNDPDTQIPALFRQNASYYLIGFEPSPGARAGTARKLEVKVNQSRVEVRTSSQYRVPGGEPSATDTIASREALDNPVPEGGIPLQIVAMPIASAVRGAAPVVVALTVGEPNVETDVLHVDIRADTDDGREERSGQEVVRWIPRDGPTGDREGTVFSHLTLPPGLHHIRAAVQSAALSRTGSVSTDVEVPDFTKAPLSLSGVVLHSDFEEVTAGSDGLAQLVPAMPTTRRVFTAADHVKAALDICEGESTPKVEVALETQITNEHGDGVYGKSETFAADQFGPPGGDQASSVVLPLERLAPGRYLLSFVATAGSQRFERDVQFSVK